MFRSIGIVISWLPTIVATVTAVEHLVGSGSGKEKKEVALEAIFRVLGKAGIAVTSSVRAIISGVIDVIVAVLNILGVAGFSDSEDQEILDFVPASYLAEEENEEVEDDIVWEPSAPAYPNDDRIDEILGSFSE